MALARHGPLQLRLCSQLHQPWTSRATATATARTIAAAAAAAAAAATNLTRSLSTHANPKPRSQEKPRSSSVRRYSPAEAERFFRNGKLHTTPENLAFIRDNDLEPDNGSMTRFTPTADARRVAQKFNVSVAYGPRLVIHPHDLRFLDPRGHPMAGPIRSKYARRQAENPFSIISTCVGGPAAVVRITAQRRLKHATYRALEALGYAPHGVGLRGTLWITVHDAVKAANLQAQEFGDVMAEALHRSIGRKK